MRCLGQVRRYGVTHFEPLALRCDSDERDHLFHLAGLTPPPRRARRHIRPGLISLAERLTDVPVCICTDLDEVLWQNPLADAVLGGGDNRDGRARNFAWRWFTEPDARERFPEQDWPRHSAAHVNDLRATYSRRAGEKDVTDLVHDLRERSAEFRTLWERHEVAVRRYDRKPMPHPEVGLLAPDLRTVAHTRRGPQAAGVFPTEGTDAREKLDLLRVIGTQEFQTTI